MRTKLHALADAQGRPVQGVLGPGQQPDCTRAVELRRRVGRTRKVLADEAYAPKQVLAAVAALGAEAVLPSQPRRRVPRGLDQGAYRPRHGIERLLSRLQQFRRLAPCHDKTASSNTALFSLSVPCSG